MSRLAHHCRPFTYTGVDYFGPIEVTIGRRREKRWGVIFTCLTTRAIHLELASSLFTDSAIMAVRRMIARRGCPTEMMSDNGTNFRGAETELKRALLDVNWDRIEDFAVNKGFKWKFIPPAAPHMGGCWERLIKCVKTALKAILKERAPREETLRTLLAKTEHTVNSRPLTHVSEDLRDGEALTPNHFLIGASSGTVIPGKFNNADLYSRKQWRIAQRLADMFWNRWVREYTPTLITRTKWSQENTALKVGDIVVVVDCALPSDI